MIKTFSRDCKRDLLCRPFQYLFPYFIPRVNLREAFKCWTLYYIQLLKLTDSTNLKWELQCRQGCRSTPYFAVK